MLIFVNNIPVYIQETVESLKNAQVFNFKDSKLSHHNIEGNVIISNAPHDYILAYITFLQHDKKAAVEQVVFLVPNSKLFKEFLKRKLEFIKAAGGVIENDSKEVLFMKRLGVWDLPKGKADNNEKWITTAEREVEEECNITVNVHDKIATTWHTYSMKGNLVIKKTKWFYMTLRSDKNMKPQKEEGIEELKWFKTAEFPVIYENTYRSIQYVIQKYLEII